MGTEGGGLFDSKPYDLQYYNDEKFLVLSAGNSVDEMPLNGGLNLHSREVSIGINSITENDSNWYIQNSSNTNSCIFYPDLSGTDLNKITINEIDTINYFMIGEFQFSAINECNDTIHITEGFFDLNYTF